MYINTTPTSIVENQATSLLLSSIVRLPIYCSTTLNSLIPNNLLAIISASVNFGDANVLNFQER